MCSLCLIAVCTCMLLLLWGTGGNQNTLSHWRVPECSKACSLRPDLCRVCQSNAVNPLQGEAIAVNLREMFGFRVPILSVVIGEGGSGGALAIGCANRNLIMEHSVYYVASPEACAAILWKARDKAATVGLSQPTHLMHSTPDCTPAMHHVSAQPD